MAGAPELLVELTAIRISQLRGFDDATLSLREGLTLLVGPNNSGKTSVLRILDWVLNRASDDVLLGRSRLTAEELDLLVPARKTGGGARRITLSVRIPDGRRRRRFAAEGDSARLRIGVTSEGVVRVNVGSPKRGEKESDASAIDLLHAVRRCTEYGLVPSSRDAASESFQNAFADAVRARLEQRAIHARRAGAPAEYRRIKRALSELEDVGRTLVSPLWEEMRALLPPGLASGGRLEVSVKPEDLIPWLVQQVELRLTTGEHDVNSVAPIEVGSGLQSLLELVTQQAAASIGGGSRILAIEEPEAFLHPSAQRTLARVIARELPGKRVVSTHSPLLVEEASYGEVVLVRNHRFFEPAALEDRDPRRLAINTALLSGYGAEMSFASGVLLVEGDGDRLYFEALRRRIAQVLDAGAVDELYVVPTGGKTAFAPWLRLLSSYGREGDRPVSWLAAPDGDAATEMRRAWHDAGLQIAAPVRSALDALAQTGRRDLGAALAGVTAVNRAADGSGMGLHMLPVDVEHAATMALSDTTARRLGEALGASCKTAEDLRNWLRGDKHKAPWMRAVLGRDTPRAEVAAGVISLLHRWLRSVLTEAEIRTALKKF